MHMTRISHDLYPHICMSFSEVRDDDLPLLDGLRVCANSETIERFMEERVVTCLQSSP